MAKKGEKIYVKYIKNLLKLDSKLDYNSEDNVYIDNTNSILIHVANYDDYQQKYTKFNKIALKLKNIKKIVIIWTFVYNIKSKTKFIPIIISNYSKHNSSFKADDSKFFYNNNYEVGSQWVSASKTRNYLMDDPIIDYLEYNNLNEPNDLLNQMVPKQVNNNKNKSKKRKYSEISSSDSEDIDNTTFLSAILNNGNNFEYKIIDKIKELYPNNVVSIVKNNNHNLIQDPHYYNITMEMIKSGVPIIYQGVLHDAETKTYGSPDLIVRSDYINKMFSTKVDVYTEKLDSTNQLAYYIIDIKNSNMHLSSNNDNVLNYVNTKPFKGQIAIYHQILSKIQKFDVNKAFILASKWTRKQKDNVYQCSNPFDRLGIIEFDSNDKLYIESSNEAVKWIQLIRNPDNDLDCLNPNNDNLYPNMCNSNDGKYKRLKKYLAEKNHEITNVWMCGIKHRKKAIKQGIVKWSDPRLSSNILGINGNNGKIVDLIVNMNRNTGSSTSPTDLSNIIYPRTIKSTFNNWRDEGLAFYIDFETLNTTSFTQREWINMEINNPNANDLIFMIGVGYCINSKWKYKCFTVSDLSDINQISIINKLFNYIKKISKKHRVNYQNVNLYHWSNFEPIVLSKLCTKHNIMLPYLKWTDILKIFHEEPIIIKGAFDFSLKSIGKALYQHQLIDVYWDSSLDIENGLDAMYYAYKVYKRDDLTKKEIMKKMCNIQKYNEVDCKIMWSILNVLRTNC